MKDIKRVSKFISIGFKISIKTNDSIDISFNRCKLLYSQARIFLKQTVKAKCRIKITAIVTIDISGGIINNGSPKGCVV